MRELHKMARPLGDADLDPAASALPAGFSARAFVPGQDEQAWLATNAAAFAHHPEQGRLALADLQERMDQPWFDAAGFILVEADATIPTLQVSLQLERYLHRTSRPSTGPRSTPSSAPPWTRAAGR